MEGALGRGPEQNPQAEILQRLESAVGAIQDSQSFRKWLDVSSRFHTYSLGNQLLITAQRPDATRVAGFQAWLKLGRHVRKGEKGIKIIVPRTGKIQSEDGSEERLLTGFGVGHVFDIRQTEGDPLPEFSVPTLEGEDGHELWEGLHGFALSEGISVRLVAPDELPRHAMGYYSPDTMEIVVGAYGQRQRTKTLAHELGHHVAHVDDRAENECIAEGIAYVVCAHFGLDTGERSFPYVATWAQDKPVLRGVLTTIHSASAGLISAIERNEPSGPDGGGREAMTFHGQIRMQLEIQAPARLEEAASTGGDIQLLDSVPSLRRSLSRGAHLTLAELEMFDPASRPGRRERRFCCPLPACAAKPRDANHRSLSLSLATGLWHCHRCGLSGCLDEDERQPGRAAGDPRTPNQLSSAAARALGRDNSWSRHLRDSVPASNTPAEEYLLSRAIPLEVIQRAGVRYSPSFFGRAAVLFPLRDQAENIVAIHGRYIDREEPRMRTAGSKRDAIFDPLGAFRDAPVAVAEAPIDALSLLVLGLPAVATCGTSWPAWLPDRLSRSHVFLAFDADVPGDIAAEHLRAALIARGALASRLRPYGGKDWNDSLVAHPGLARTPPLGR